MYAEPDLSWRLFLAVLLVLGVLAFGHGTPSNSVRAQAPGDSPSIAINQLDASGYPDLRLVVTVLDSRGLPVTGLTPAQFQAFDGTTQIAVVGALAAQDEALRLNVILTIDVSGSMLGEPLASAKAAAVEFVQSLGVNDRVALVSFSDDVRPVLPLTNDKAALSTAIDGLVASGGTALYEAVQVSTYLASAAASDGQRAVVVLLSDGENDTQASTATSESSLDISRGSGIPVYPIAFGSLTDVVYLEQLAQSTHGQFRAATSGTVASVYAELSTLLRSQYVVTVRAETPADGADASLQLVAFVGSTSANVVAPFRRGSPAAVVPPATAPGGGAPTGAEDNSRSNLLAFGFAALAGLAAVVGAVLFLRRWQEGRRDLAHQMQVVAPNARAAAAQGVPQRSGSLARTANPAAVTETGTGLLVERGGEGRRIEIGGGPVIVGSSSNVCQLVLRDGGGIAPQHARIWLRGGRYVLHHVGGLSRKTLVNGAVADWLVLDPGDEIVIGMWHFTFEDSSVDEASR